MIQTETFKRVDAGEKAFSLLEVLIALSIAMILWGSLSFFMVSLQKKLKYVMISQKVKAEQAAILQFQVDVHSASRMIQPDLNCLILAVPGGNVTYRNADGVIVREWRKTQTPVLDSVSSNAWECLSKKDVKNKDLNACVGVLWKYRHRGEVHEVYASKKTI